MNLNDNDLNQTGAGTVKVNNRMTTIAGTANINNGTLAGSGTVGGNLNNSGGTLSPGNSPGILTINGDYTQGAGAVQPVAHNFGTSGTGSSAAVPESTTVALIGIGVAGLCAARGRLRDAMSPG